MLTGCPAADIASRAKDFRGGQPRVFSPFRRFDCIQWNGRVESATYSNEPAPCRKICQEAACLVDGTVDGSGGFSDREWTGESPIEQREQLPVPGGYSSGCRRGSNQNTVHPEIWKIIHFQYYIRVGEFQRDRTGCPNNLPHYGAVIGATLSHHMGSCEMWCVPVPMSGPHSCGLGQEIWIWITASRSPFGPGRPHRAPDLFTPCDHFIVAISAAQRSG